MPLPCVTVVDLFHVQDALDCTLHLFGLTIFLEILCFLLQKKLFIPGNLY